jgi:hypothetical protein
MVRSKRLVGQPAKQATLQERIEEMRAADYAFDALVRSGCQQDKFLVFLEGAFLLLENPERQGPKFWRGYGRDFLRRLADLRSAASVMETLSRSILGEIFRVGCHANQRQCFEAIPALLRGYSGWLEQSWKNLPKQLGKSLPIAALMRYVHRATGAWHDHELANLLAIAGDKLTFMPQDLKNRRSVWRRKSGFWEEAGALGDFLAQDPSTLIHATQNPSPSKQCESSSGSF